MEGNLITLANGLVVSVDWLSFTVTSTNDLVDVLDMLGYTTEDFTRRKVPVATGLCFGSMAILSASFVMGTRIWAFMWT